jgi:excisionase family DNA binding protein
MDKKLVTVAEAALIMQVSRALLYQKVMSGEIPSIKIGRARRIPMAAIDEFIARGL